MAHTKGKQETWNSIKENIPELQPIIKSLAEVFGIKAIAVKDKDGNICSYGEFDKPKDLIVPKNYRGRW